MNAKTLLFLIPVALVILIIRTLEAVFSVDARGRAVPAKLERPIAVDGKVAIPAGKHLSGKVITSRRLAHSNDRLTVDLTSAHLAGRDVPIITTGPQLLSNDIHTRGSVVISRANYTGGAGKLMQFQLARPLVF